MHFIDIFAIISFCLWPQSQKRQEIVLFLICFQKKRTNSSIFSSEIEKIPDSVISSSLESPMPDSSLIAIAIHFGYEQWYETYPKAFQVNVTKLLSCSGLRNDNYLPKLSRFLGDTQFFNFVPITSLVRLKTNILKWDSEFLNSFQSSSILVLRMPKSSVLLENWQNSCVGIRFLWSTPCEVLNRSILRHYTFWVQWMGGNFAKQGNKESSWWWL